MIRNASTTADTSMSSRGRIPSLDGLRATSILLVLVSHTVLALARRGAVRLPLIATPGATGVAVFFGISGFIITTLLVREQAGLGVIDLRGFYVRRAFRILPALWVFLAASVLIGPKMGFAQYGHALLFLTDYWLTPNWWLAHTWSLSVEEQFYLLWPLTLRLLGRRRATVVVALILVSAPALRIACHFIFPGLRGQVAYNFHTNMDVIMAGCLVALLRSERPDSAALRLVSSPLAAIVSTAFLLVLDPILADCSPGRYVLTAGLSLRAVAVGSILGWAISDRRHGLVWRFLNSSPVVHLGIISYSLYLWQQPFFDPTVVESSLVGVFLAVTGALLAAELSYRLVEVPALSLRARLTRPSEPALWSPPR